jgi:Tfp pilus assembly protein PilO
MDLKDPKTQKILLVVIGFLVIAYVWYSQIYAKTSKKIEDKYAQYESLLTKLNVVEQKAKNLEKLKAEYNDLLKSYQPMETLLPEDLEFSSLLNQIHAGVQSSRSVVFELKPGGREVKNHYDEINYTVTLISNYHDLGNFFADVSNFPFIVNVTKVKLEKYEPLPMEPKVEDKTVRANFTLTAYNANNKTGDEAEESGDKKGAKAGAAEK